MEAAQTDGDLVEAVRAGDEQAFATLFERWADRCYDVARRIVHDDGRAGEVTQEVFTVAWQQLDTLRDPAAFGGWVLRSARNRALNKRRDEHRTTPVADDDPALRTLDSGRSVELEAQALDHQELVWAASAALGDRDASILDLHLRHDLSVPEIAEELGVTTNNAHQLLFRMKDRLGVAIRAYVLVRGGRPSCTALRVQLDDAGITGFGADAAKLIAKHTKTCEECDRRQGAILSPSSMFAAVPVVAMGALVRADVAHGLAGAGVPVGSAAPAVAAAPGDGPGSGTGGAARGSGAVAGRRRSLLIGAVAAAAIVLAVIAAVVLGGGDDPAPETAAPPTSVTTPDDGGRGGGEDTDTAPASTTTTAVPGDALVGSWTADAGDILGANTTNVGGPGGLTCSGPITMTFTEGGTFERSGSVTCSVAGTSQSGAVASAGRYQVEGDTLTVSGFASSGSTPDAFGNGSATYDLSGDTLSITFTDTSVGTVSQTYQRS
jgi:RNA polymerase sigma factor (sigma-70 family)